MPLTSFRIPQNGHSSESKVYESYYTFICVYVCVCVSLFENVVVCLCFPCIPTIRALTHTHTHIHTQTVHSLETRQRPLCSGDKSSSFSRIGSRASG